MHQVAHLMWSSFIPLFVNEGLSETEAEDLALKTYVESADPGTKQLYVNYHVLYAFKPGQRPEVACSKGPNS